MYLFIWPLILWIKTINQLHLGKLKFYIFYVLAQRILPLSPESPSSDSSDSSDKKLFLPKTVFPKQLFVTKTTFFYKEYCFTKKNCFIPIIFFYQKVCFTKKCFHQKNVTKKMGNSNCDNSKTQLGHNSKTQIVTKH